MSARTIWRQKLPQKKKTPFLFTILFTQRCMFTIGYFPLILNELHDTPTRTVAYGLDAKNKALHLKTPLLFFVPTYLLMSGHTGSLLSYTLSIFYLGPLFCCSFA